jgi:3-methyladenine DNA glycosylase AlkD
MTRTTTAQALTWLEKNGTKATRDGLARYGIQAKQAFGITMGQLLVYRKKLGQDHELAVGLWESGWYEARVLASLIGDPERLTVRQMNAWAAGFENWGDCDTVCFQLFDRSPHAWGRAAQWARSPREFVKRGGFALMACLALHDKTAPDAKHLAFLPLIEKGARDERNFVKKGVSWALRSIGRRAGLAGPSNELAKRLAQSEDAAARWVGNDALRQFSKARKGR